MMKHEFEALAGYEVTFEDYNNIIEPMYMATNLSKQEFVKVIDRKRFDFRAKEKAEKKAMIKAMREIAEERAQNCEYFGDYEAEDKLLEIARKFREKYYPENLGYWVDIERLHWANLSSGCSYPADLVIYKYRSKYELIEEERITLARWKKAC